MRAPAASPDASWAPLVFDDDGSEARRFCSTTELAPSGAAGDLAALRCSGSAQPSAAAFRDVKRRLAVGDDDLYVVDLRQESHGFVNGAAVSWYAASNWGCAGLSDDEALALEAVRLRLLGLAERVRIGRAEAIKHGTPQRFTECERPAVAAEPDAFELPPGRYVRLPVTDHARPSDAAVDRFVALLRGLRGAHVHLHCRGGKGRTATFLAIVDLLRNAARLPLTAILARQAALSGYDLTKPAAPAAPKAPFIAERLAFVERFHAYARDNCDGEPVLWSTWLAAQAGPA
jgi:hypothetical protein